MTRRRLVQAAALILSAYAGIALLQGLFLAVDADPLALVAGIAAAGTSAFATILWREA